MRDLQRLRWQGEASAVVEPHELHRYLLQRLEAVRRSPVISSKFTVAKSPLAPLKETGAEESSTATASGIPGVAAPEGAATSTPPCVDRAMIPMHPRSLTRTTQEEPTVVEGEPFVSCSCVASFNRQDLLIEFLSKSVSAGDHSGSHAAGLPHARRDAPGLPVSR